MIKVTDIDLTTMSGTKIYIDVDIFRFIADEDLFDVEIEIEENGEYKQFETVDLNDIAEIVVDHNDLQRVALNWIFKNVEVVKSLNDSSKKETAQEVEVQEQYVGKCEHCNKDNKVMYPIRIKTPEYCMKCGNKIVYSVASTTSLNVVSSPQKGQ